MSEMEKWKKIAQTLSNFNRNIVWNRFYFDILMFLIIYNFVAIAVAVLVWKFNWNYFPFFFFKSLICYSNLKELLPVDNNQGQSVQGLNKLTGSIHCHVVCRQVVYINYCIIIPEAGWIGFARCLNLRFQIEQNKNRTRMSPVFYLEFYVLFTLDTNKPGSLRYIDSDSLKPQGQPPCNWTIRQKDRSAIAWRKLALFDFCFCFCFSFIFLRTPDHAQSKYQT